MKKTIRIAIVDFAHNEAYLVQRLLDFVADDFHFEVTEDNPDFVLHSCFGRRVLKFNGVRVFYTGENQTPDFNLSDYALGFDRLDFGDRYLRLPLYRLYPATYPKLLNGGRVSDEPHKRPDFCACVVSNKEREPAFEELLALLGQHGAVRSGGKLFNNVGGPVADKIAFLQKARFGLAVENTSRPGYITEKITDVFAAGAIPIYWGAPDAAKDFNPAAFVNCHDYPTLRAAADAVIALDRDPARYAAMLAEPPFFNNAEPAALDAARVRDFLRAIFNNAEFRRNRILRGRIYERDLRNA
ncbi:MAG: glycosyltransferase family 10, partial [Kiritimatiellaeota bacterium]|nr:glycosyltransferase family 10 [Kiritimatiellota bacterium]